MRYAIRTRTLRGHESYLAEEMIPFTYQTLGTYHLSGNAVGVLVYAILIILFKFPKKKHLHTYVAANREDMQSLRITFE